MKTDKVMILVVDDDESILKVMSIIFERQGYLVTRESNGLLAFDSAIRNSPNLIILDVHLGTIDGRDVCNTLKHSIQTQNIPVIMYSANASREMVMQYCNPDDYVPKPFNVKDMINAVEKHIA